MCSLWLDATALWAFENNLNIDLYQNCTDESPVPPQTPFFGCSPWWHCPLVQLLQRSYKDENISKRYKVWVVLIPGSVSIVRRWELTARKARPFRMILQLVELSKILSQHNFLFQQFLRNVFHKPFSRPGISAHWSRWKLCWGGSTGSRGGQQTCQGASRKHLENSGLRIVIYSV